MASWETDGEPQSRSTVTPKPIADDGASRTTPVSRRKSTSRRSLTPPASSSSPRLNADRFDKRSSRDIANDESISILDPRRFTPTLHANLVSEILTLKRDQDEKARQIESLESSLYNTKTEHELLQADFTTTSKESRSLKRQLALLEGGTSSALDELSRERDDAVDAITETKKRLDAAQKKLRNQEDDSQRVHEQWAQEKDGWLEERRKYERKLHTTESRLKMVLQEVAMLQVGQSGEKQGEHHPNSDDSEPEESGRENDAGSVRTMSMTNSIRQSLITGPGLQQGHSLADELNFDDDETDADGRESVLSHHHSPKHTRTYSRDGPSRLSYHRKNMSLESLRRPGSVARSRLFANPAVLEVLEGEDKSEKPQMKPPYVDSGVQYSPPPSPEPKANAAVPEVASRPGRSADLDSSARGDSEVEANQRKKRVQASRPLVMEPSRSKDNMVSKSAQTTDMPLSPPKTPPSVSQQHFLATTVATTATQTDPTPAVPNRQRVEKARLIPSPPPVPSINIQPPTSRPTTPREPRLPQYVKNFGCQVNLSLAVETTDASAQTEGIQVDKRLALLPSYLQPSTISSRPNSPGTSQGVEVEIKQDTAPGQEDLPPRNPKRLEGRCDSGGLESLSTVGKENGNVLGESLMSFVGEGPSNQSKSSRTYRLSGFFNEVDSQSSDDGNHFGEAEGSDSEFRTALSAPKPKRTSKSTTRRGSFGVANERPKTRISTQSDTDLQSSLGQARKASSRKNFQKKLVTIPDEAAAADESTAASGSHRSSTIRKAAIIQNGLVREQSRSRSPSLPEGRYPPYPIPARFSSRRSQIGSETPSDGQGSPTRFDSWHTRGSSRSSYQSQSIRKVRSAAALSRHHRYRRHGSRSPPPLSPSTEAPGSPTLPPLPRNDITSPRMGSTGRERGHPTYRRHRQQPSANTENTANTNITSPTADTTGSQSAGVVDAIAQTMVGEWMLKYVRRRKAFNVPENTGKDDNGNDRHKRWVWLAPYERAILWSSKQPSSGSALLGKAGRKLIIQSVLDVKDDNPPPRVMPTVFNRSILILTPQRALKFTAESAERHYLWLTALSFLAHSSQEVPEIIPSSQQLVKQVPTLQLEIPPPKIRRGGIRDSIRIAKGRAGSTKSGAPTIPSIPSAPPSRKSGLAEQDASGTTGKTGTTGTTGTAGTAGAAVGHSRESSTKSAAEPPFVPRFSERSFPAVATHGRKRSNTGGHVAPPLSFRGFSGPAGSAQYNSAQSTQSTPNTSVDTYGEASDIFAASQASSNTTWNMSQSGRTSEASCRPSNFFDAVGTMRMEAFISPLAQARGELDHDALGKVVRRRSKEIRRRHSRSRSRRRDSSGYRPGRGEYRSDKQWAVDEDYFVPDDPFKGF